MPRHFSMLREFHLADWFTLANAFCGTGAIFAAMRFLQDGEVRNLMIGMALIPLALKGVKYREVSAAKMLSGNLLVYGLGGIAVPFAAIKAIDMLLTATGVIA